ncbi:GNAT family acetyltransferase [Methanobrevibacter sp. YE315]|uniref:GNAT family N-acetyltransferase n=1 Tax=Methanobrevibacter sp. YE315 TaxID=1609968 RepID=UPI000764E905|nr:GNAT family N-acetyltransferase [Methanobrevibacter sp. YE315]AMD17966.1 GNAT family acetyltransferase [Methanobrevibacter sp. YE315]
MDFTIKELNDDPLEIENVKDFLYGQIRKVYDIGPTPEFHYDIDGIDEYYIKPSRNAFFVVYYEDKIVATAAIRAYDKDYEFFRGIYSKEDTASVWRLMVDEEYKRRGIARSLVNAMEEFAKKVGYTRIYLNTHRYLDAALAFWESMGYEITVEEDDYDETNHMVKVLN